VLLVSIHQREKHFRWLAALIKIVHELRAKKLGRLLLKLDFEKSYDRVKWDFLAEVVRCKG
jgi:hypothetical protein